MSAFGDLGQRAVVGLVLAVVAIGSLAAGGLVMVAFVAVLTGVMLWEVLGMGRSENQLSTGASTCLIALGVASVIALYFNPLAGFLLATLTVVGGVFLSRSRMGFWSLAGVVLVLAATASLTQLRLGPDGFWIVFWIIMCVVAADVGAYLSKRQRKQP